MKNKILIAAGAIVIIALAVLALGMIKGSDYSSAYERTKNLKNYTMNISTVVNLENNGNIKQTVIDQTVRVKNKGSDKMIYQVETLSTSTDAATGKVVSEENSYIYKNEKYYYSYPGVKYFGTAEKDKALSNVENISDVISFPYDKMYNVTEDDGEYSFQVENADISQHVNAMIDFAVGQFENVNFTFDGINVTATVKDKYITDRSFLLNYTSGEGQKITIEVYTTLLDKNPAIEDVDESKYVNMMG